MSKYLFCIFALFLCASCDKDKENELPEPPSPPVEKQDTLFWEQPHSLFMGLKGQVKSSVLLGMDEEEEFEVTRQTAEFDTCGHLLCYDPSGLSVSSFRGTSRPYDAGWIDPTVYRYRYDQKGRMMNTMLETMGIDTLVYRLEYGDHNCYVPLPFAIADCPMFLLKGLSKVTSKDFSYVFNGMEASFQQTSWSGTLSVTYHFNGNYPDKCLETLYRGDDTISQKVITYAFGADGRLISENSIRSYWGETSTERTEILYAPTGLLLPTSHMEWFDGELSSRCVYTYDEAGNLTEKTVERENNKEKEESNAYSGVDGCGNWTKRGCTLPGIGILQYERVIVYY